MPWRAPKHGQAAIGRRQEHRRPSSQRGYTAAWRKSRAVFLAKHPLCRECQARGKVEPATVVDHINPHKGDMNVFWDVANWQALCKECHDRKTGRGE